ncbi:MAG: class II aldolase/adducin family protein [Candidatus Methylarchaceae archaeon HK02M1]|nr:class II aldolase/adducin family protein [Candidatus Methylarchaceae archaeon HK02M1]
MSNLEDHLRMDVVNGAKAIFHKGLVDVGEGNVSTRIPKEEELFITPTFSQYETMTKDDVVHLKFDGTQLSKGRRASTEYRLHVAIYKARPKARCVIHTHSPYATMLSVVRKKIPVILEEMVVFLGGPVNISEFGRAHTYDIGEKALKALGKTNAILLANHGVLVCGRTMEHAVKMAELVEKMAMIYWGSSQIAEPVIISEESRLKKDFDSNFSTYGK